jgi:hypothetical protein
MKERREKEGGGGGESLTNLLVSVVIFKAGTVDLD